MNIMDDETLKALLVLQTSTSQNESSVTTEHNNDSGDEGHHYRDEALGTGKVDSLDHLYEPRPIAEPFTTTGNHVIKTHSKDSSADDYDDDDDSNEGDSSDDHDTSYRKRKAIGQENNKDIQPVSPQRKRAMLHHQQYKQNEIGMSIGSVPLSYIAGNEIPMANIATTFAAPMPEVSTLFCAHPQNYHYQQQQQQQCNKKDNIEPLQVPTILTTTTASTDNVMKLLSLLRTMENTQQSQRLLQDWDYRTMGVRKCHNKTMQRTSKSRRNVRALIQTDIASFYGQPNVAKGA